MTATTHPCPACAGDGRTAFRTGTRPCRTCRTSGEVTIDPEAIAAALLVSRGRTAGQFRRSRPTLPEDGGVYGAAYVWRMIRFHAGHDMHLPIAATWYVGVWASTEATKTVIDTLDTLTDTIGAQLFGKATMMRAAVRWGAALYGGNAPVGPDGPAAAVTFGQLAEALGVSGVDGLDIGGVDESPEAALTAALDLDGNLDPTEAAAILAADPRPDHA